MNKKEKLWEEAAFSAVANNDIEALRENLDRLMLLKKPSVIKDIFNKFKYLGSHLLELGEVKNSNKRFVEDLLTTSLNNNHNNITSFLQSDEFLIKPEFKGGFIWENIFAKGEVKDIEHLLKNAKVTEKERARLITNGMGCIKESNIEILHTLFDSSRSDYSEFINNFNKYNRINSPVAVFNPFIFACSQNSIALVDFYLNKEDIKPFINAQTFHNGILRAANNDKSLDVLEHLLTTPNMTQKSYQDYFPNLQDQLIYMATLGNATEVLKFLIFDMDIKLKESVDDILNIENQAAFNSNFGIYSVNDNEYKKSVEITKKLFGARDLKEQLQDDLGNSLTSKSKKLKL